MPLAEMPSLSSSSLLICLLFFVLCPSLAQQGYPAVFTNLDCTVHHTENAGYVCNSMSTPSCHTLAYYRVQSGTFDNLQSIATQLFGTTASAIASASSLPSASSPLSVGQGLFIPFNCTCSGSHYVYNITYSIMPGDTFAKLSNNTYEGLTTCQAIQDENPTAVPTDLQIGQPVVFPLRCACPSQQQVSSGIKLLVTYPVTGGDNVSSVTRMFSLSGKQEFLFANNLSNSSVPLFPATTVLVPQFVVPTVPPNSTSGAAASPSSISSSSSSSSSSKTGIYIGVGIAAGILLLLFGAGCFVVKKRRATKGQVLAPIVSPPKVATPVKSPKPQQDLFWDMSSFTDSEKLRKYTLEELKQATQNFSPSTQIRGSVYRGVLKGQVVAVKNMTRNVSKELQILQKVHHANLVTLLGVCLSSPEQSYLVYEYAENGSLSDWLHENDFSIDYGSTSTLTWNNRLQVALDVAAALEYIHDHTSPSYVHKDIKSSNILLDSKFRGKVANFGLAKSADDMDQGSALTRHIVGTQGYMAPEYLAHGLVSTKMDVFAFGVVLLEILSGKEATMRDKEKGAFLSELIGPLVEGEDAKERLKDWMDRRLENAYPLDCAYSVALLARSCVADNPDARPSAREVAYALAKLLTTSQEWEPSGVLEENYTENQLEAR